MYEPPIANAAIMTTISMAPIQPSPHFIESLRGPHYNHARPDRKSRSSNSKPAKFTATISGPTEYGVATSLRDADPPRLSRFQQIPDTNLELLPHPQRPLFSSLAAGRERCRSLSGRLR